jgi:hypothetical protein
MRGCGPLLLSAVATIPPLITLAVFLVVFVIGRASNVAQLAGPNGSGLWMLWASGWIFFVAINPIAFIVGVVAILLPPYRPLRWRSLVSRFAALGCSACACYAVGTYFPDA